MMFTTGYAYAQQELRRNGGDRTLLNTPSTSPHPTLICNDTL
ncbi:hypothetical protein [Nostoc commune]|nr:hypothetical protein [Nostoc commune]